MSVLRVRPDIKGSAVTLLDGRLVVLQADMAFDSSDELVVAVCKATGCQVSDWFQTDNDDDAPRRGPGRPRRVEQATDSGLQ